MRPRPEATAGDHAPVDAPSPTPTRTPGPRPPAPPPPPARRGGESDRAPQAAPGAGHDRAPAGQPRQRGAPRDELPKLLERSRSMMWSVELVPGARGDPLRPGAVARRALRGA